MNLCFIKTSFPSNLFWYFVNGDSAGLQPYLRLTVSVPGLCVYMRASVFECSVWCFWGWCVGGLYGFCFLHACFDTGIKPKQKLLDSGVCDNGRYRFYMKCAKIMTEMLEIVLLTNCLHRDLKLNLLNSHHS